MIVARFASLRMSLARRLSEPSTNDRCGPNGSIRAKCSAFSRFFNRTRFRPQTLDTRPTVTRWMVNARDDGRDRSAKIGLEPLLAVEQGDHQLRRRGRQAEALVAEVTEEMLVEQLTAFELGPRERLVGVAQRDEMLALETR